MPNKEMSVWRAILAICLFPFIRLGMSCATWGFWLLAKLVMLMGRSPRGVYNLESDVTMTLFWILVLIAEGRKAADIAVLEVNLAANAALMKRRR